MKRNLALETGNIVQWCRRKIKTADDIRRKGKNWYVSGGGCVITINAHSYTIITAHGEKGKHRATGMPLE